MNSSNRISPGVSRTSLRPNEANPPLLVDPHGMLTEAPVPQRLETVVGRHHEVAKQRLHLVHR
jgi:hypothetical protein